MRGQVSIEGTKFPARHLRGQVSTELLVIIAVVLAIFVPLLVMVYFKANEANEEISSYQAELAVFRLAYLANSVGSLGTETSMTTDVFIPAGVSEIRTRNVPGTSGAEIIFKVQTPAGDSEIVEIVKYPIKNPDTFTPSKGWARFNITSEYENGEALISISSTR